MISDFKYAAFVMTFKRESQLFNTINCLKRQTLPPLKILVIDNDDLNSAKNIADSTGCDYFSVGFNSGPSGASFWGLKLLFEAGWEWVLWIDDDDPPVFDDSIERISKLLHVSKESTRIGMIGAVGTLFNAYTAKTIRIHDTKAIGILDVDHVAGNMLPIINRKVYESGILPFPNLFFGFEELCFCLRIKRAGYKILISGEELLRYRINANRIGFSRKKIHFDDYNKIWREYYSVRNLLYILLYEERNIVGACLFTFKMIFKSIIGFIKGFEYGKYFLKVIFWGLIDGWLRRFPIRFI